jgi:hypothetical protein
LLMWLGLRREDLARAERKPADATV